tara:strand:- start:3781 stop:3933 length:153 start_codon:yes stop_codon:yes gene_type:complete
MELTWIIGLGLVCWGYCLGISYTQILRWLEQKFDKKISGDIIKEDDNKHD